MKSVLSRLLFVCLAGLHIQAFAEEAYLAKVTRILDGDTVEVVRSDGAQKKVERIRLASIDAPESSQDYGQASKQALAGLCFGRVARIDPHKHDRYGRTLASVNCDGVDSAMAQVATGMAWVYVQYNSDAKLVSLERQARQDRLGLWSMSTPMPPWEFRKLR